MADLTIVCIDCGRDFIWNEAEQEYFKKNGLKTPKRCFACRKKRREQIAQQQNGK